MSYLRLLTSQRNDLFRVLESRQLSPADFQWSYRPGEAFGWTHYEVPALERSGTEFFYAIGENPWGGFDVAYSPGTEGRTGGATKLSWQGVLGHAEMWAVMLGREAEAEDLWAQFAPEAGKIAQEAKSLGNEPFSPVELQRVREGLTRIEQQVLRTQSLSKQQTDLLLGAVKEVEQAAGRVGRKDWVLLAIGTLVSAAAQAALDPTTGKAIMQGAAAALSWIVGHPQHLGP